MPGGYSDNKLLLLLLLFYFLQTVSFWYCSEKLAIYPNYVPSNWEQQWVLWGHTCTLTHTKIRHPSRKRHRYWHIQMLLRFAGTNVIPRFIEELSSLHTFSGFQIYYFLLPWIGPKADRFSTIPHKEASSTFILYAVSVAGIVKHCKYLTHVKLKELRTCTGFKTMTLECSTKLSELGHAIWIIPFLWSNIQNLIIGKTHKLYC